MKQIIENNSKNLDLILSLIILLFSIGFFVTGSLSYFQNDFTKSIKLLFFPQGITMIFYISLGLISNINQLSTLYFKVGDGFNEFDKEKETLRITEIIFQEKNLT